MAEQNRCPWSTKDPLYIAYHDEEWGRPNRDGRRLFEKIILEAQVFVILLLLQKEITFFFLLFAEKRGFI
nr:DNA-3-methyladenine glycosylase I [Euryarchaeota archaeon]